MAMKTAEEGEDSINTNDGVLRQQVVKLENPINCPKTEAPNKVKNRTTRENNRRSSQEIEYGLTWANQIGPAETNELLKLETMSEEDESVGVDPLQLLHVDLLNGSGPPPAIKEEPCDVNSLGMKVIEGDPEMDPLISNTARAERARTRMANSTLKEKEVTETGTQPKRRTKTNIQRLAARLKNASIEEENSISTNAEEDDETSERVRRRRLQQRKYRSRLRQKQLQSETEEETLQRLRQSAKKQRELRFNETHAEVEKRRLKQRITKMKSRLLEQLINSEDHIQAQKQRRADQMRSYRQRKREMETPEEAAERKRRQNIQKFRTRSRRRAIETPEEAQERKATAREYLLNKIANETDEERAARRERVKQGRIRKTERKSAKAQAEGSATATVIRNEVLKEGEESKGSTKGH